MDAAKSEALKSLRLSVTENKSPVLNYSIEIQKWRDSNKFQASLFIYYHSHSLEFHQTKAANIIRATNK